MNQPSRTSSALMFIALLVICLGAGVASSRVTAAGLSEWYPSLYRPSWSPPDRIFASAAATFAILVPIAGWLVWGADRRQTWRRSALTGWWAQLALNVAWTVIFFGGHQIAIAAAVAFLLWIQIAAFVVQTWHPRRLAALLFLPYLAWVTFAAALNLAVLELNARF